MTPQEFAQKVKAKYPEYKNFDDAELTNRIVQKYPSYGAQIKQAPVEKKPLLERAGDFVSRNNLPGSKIGENIGTQFAALKHGLETGDFETAQKISATGPTGTQIAGDVAQSAALPVAAMVPGGLSLPATIGVGAGAGAVSGAGAAAAEGGGSEEIARGGVFGGVLGGAAGLFAKAIEKGVSLIGRGTEKTGEKITQSVIRPSKVDFEDGFKMETIKKYDLGGSLRKMSEKTDAAIDDITRQVNEKYAQSSQRINLGEILDETIKKASSDKASGFGSNTSMQKAFDQIKNEIAAVSEDGAVSVPEAVTVKRAAGHFGAWVYGMTDPDSTARQKAYTAFYRQLKESIEKSSPEGVKQLNQQLSDLIPVMNSIIRRIPVAERNNAISLTDIITLTGATFEPRALGLTLLNLASKSGNVGQGLIKAGGAVAEKAGALTPAIRAAATGLSGELPLGTAQPQKSPDQQVQSSREPITEEEARKVMEMAQSFGPGGVALGIKGGAKVLVSQIAKKAGPADLERMASFLKSARSGNLNSLTSLFDNYGNFFKRVGVDDLSPDDIVKVFNDVLSKVKY